MKKNSQYNKKIITGLLALSVFLYAHTLFATDYIPLTKGFPVGGLNVFINQLIKLVLAVGSALAVLMIVFGGFQILLAGGNPNAQSSAKEMLSNALWGLGLLLISYLALNTINPDLVSFSF